jgi:hypothetical protein
MLRTTPASLDEDLPTVHFRLLDALSKALISFTPGFTPAFF